MVTPLNDHPSYIVCPACGAIELVYEPQDYQAPVHKVEPHRNPDGTAKTCIIFTAGGYGSGKSKASLEDFFLNCLENPGGTGLVTAPTLQLLKRTTLKTLFREIIPPPLIRSYNKTDGEIVLENGFVIYTIPSDDEEKLRSINAGLVHMEEASGIDRSIYDQLLTRMRDPFVRERKMYVCTNPDIGWVKEVFADNPKRADPKHPEHDMYNASIFVFIWETALNKHLPPDFIEINSKGKPEWWIKRYLKGSFEHSEGMVYPNAYKVGISPLEPKPGTDVYGIPLAWERFLTHDHGLRNPTALLSGAIDPEKGVVIIYREYYQPGRTVPEHVPHFEERFDEIPHGRLRFAVQDPACRNKTDPVNGKSVQGLYQEYGLFFEPGNNSIDAGLLRVNSYINRGCLFIYNTCVNTLKEMYNYKWPEVTLDDPKNPDEKPVKKNDHAMDALRYALMKLPDDPELLKTVAADPPKRYNNVILHDQEEDFEEDFADDFLSYV